MLASKTLREQPLAADLSNKALLNCDADSDVFWRMNDRSVCNVLGSSIHLAMPVQEVE